MSKFNSDQLRVIESSSSLSLMDATQKAALNLYRKLGFTMTILEPHERAKKFVSAIDNMSIMLDDLLYSDGKFFSDYVDRKNVSMGTYSEPDDLHFLGFVTMISSVIMEMSDDGDEYLSTKNPFHSLLQLFYGPGSTGMIKLYWDIEAVDDLVSASTEMLSKLLNPLTIAEQFPAVSCTKFTQNGRFNALHQASSLAACPPMKRKRRSKGKGNSNAPDNGIKTHFTAILKTFFCSLGMSGTGNNKPEGWKATFDMQTIDGKTDRAYIGKVTVGESFKNVIGYALIKLSLHKDKSYASVLDRLRQPSNSWLLPLYPSDRVNDAARGSKHIASFF